MTAVGLTRVTVLLATAGVSGALSAPASAAGFYLQEQSARAVGRAFSGEAADTGPQSLWWNPAAIGGATQAVGYFGASGIMPSTKVSDQGTLIVRPGQAPASVGGIATSTNAFLSGVLPSSAAVVPVSDKLAFGLALSAPYDFATKYQTGSWARYTALTTALRTIDVQPSIAIAPTSWLRLGAGPNAEYADAILSNALPNLSPLLPDGFQHLKGDGWNWGWSAGAQIHNDFATLGVSYKSSIEHRLNGQLMVSGLLGPLAASNLSTGVQARFRTPWQAIVGARVKANDKLTLDAEVTRVGWSEFDAIRLGAPVNAAVPEGYRDTWSVAGGLDYALCPQWTVRGGIQYDQTPTRDGQRDARVPDSDRLNFALGASFHATKALTFDAGASYILFKNVAIDRVTAAYAGTPVQTPILPNAELTGAHVVVLALGAQFGF
jgi:long-chain fatty acid transport protein